MKEIKKMRIGIMTYWKSESNYGQLLQCYALQKYLCDAGHDAYLIRYHSVADSIKVPFFASFFKMINPIKILRFLCYKMSVKKRQRRFYEFRKTYINQRKYIIHTPN